MPLSDIKTPSGPTAPSSLLAVSSTLPALCIIAVLLRFNVRRIQRTTLMADDWIMVPALTLVIGMGICGILGVKNEVWGYLTPADPAASTVAFEGKLLEAFQYVQITALTLVKIAALIFYRRIFRVKSHRTALDITRSVTTFIVVLWAVAMILMNTLQCGKKIDALWTGSDQYEIYCKYVEPYQTAFAITNFLLDLWIILLPLPKIFGLQVTTARKFAISGVFLLALVGLASSLARLVAYIKINSVSAINDPTNDYRLEDTLSVYWSILEAGMSLLAVNLPSLWFYRDKVSFETVLASIRSVISLHSLRSSGSYGSRTNPMPRADGLSTHSGASSVMMIGPAVERNEVYAMRDVEAQLGASPVPRGVIMVNSTIHQGKE